MQLFAFKETPVSKVHSCTSSSGTELLEIRKYVAMGKQVLAWFMFLMRNKDFDG